MDDIQFWRSGEWTMVYLNGQLVKSGDHYLAEEWLAARCGVVIVEDDAGVCIPGGHHALETLAEAEQAMAARQVRQTAAEEKRRQAAALLDEAEKMEAAQ